MATLRNGVKGRQVSSQPNPVTHGDPDEAADDKDSGSADAPGNDGHGDNGQDGAVDDNNGDIDDDDDDDNDVDEEENGRKDGRADNNDVVEVVKEELVTKETMMIPCT